MEIQDLKFVVEIDDEALEDAVARLRTEILDDTKCPECGNPAKISVETEQRKTTSNERSVVLIADCNGPLPASNDAPAGEPCGWRHRLLAGTGKLVDVKDEDDESRPTDFDPEEGDDAGGEP